MPVGGANLFLLCFDRHLFQLSLTVFFLSRLAFRDGLLFRVFFIGDIGIQLLLRRFDFIFGEFVYLDVAGLGFVGAGRRLVNGFAVRVFAFKNTRWRGNTDREECYIYCLLYTSDAADE